MKTFKRFLFICIGLFIIVLSTQALEKYEVTANTFLNIRSHGSTNAPVIGTINHGGIVNVESIDGEWAKVSFNGGYGYVSTTYIRPVTPTPPAKAPTNTFSDWFRQTNYDCRPLVYIILGLSIVLFILRMRRGESTPLEDSEHTINLSLFITVCLLELFYVFSMGAYSIWFCTPDKIGWLWTIINFFIFGAVVFNQWMCFFNTLNDVQYNSYATFNWTWGIYTWGICIIGAIICGFFFAGFLPVVGIGFLVGQSVQTGIIFNKVLPKGGWKHACICTLTYLIGSTATVLIVAHFLILLLIVLIALFLLSLLGKSSSSSGGKRCSNCSHLSGSSCNLSGRYISSPSTTYCDNYQ